MTRYCILHIMTNDSCGSYSLSTCFKIDKRTLDVTMMEGIAFQILDLGPRLYFMKCKKIRFENIIKSYSPFFN